jgi:Zn-dependent protease with chaperone function
MPPAAASGNLRPEAEGSAKGGVLRIVHLTIAGLLAAAPLAAHAKEPKPFEPGSNCAIAPVFASRLESMKVVEPRRRAAHQQLKEAVQTLLEVHVRLNAVSEKKPALMVCWEDTIVNAFARGTDGPVFFTTAILRKYGHQPDFIAGVLAHELAHIDRQHIEYKKRAIEAHAYYAQAVGRDALRKTGSLDQAKRQAVIAFMGHHSAFSREQESDADDYGTVLLSRAGFKPEAIKAVMTGMLEGGDGPAFAAWFDSHPGLLERLSRTAPRVSDEETAALARALTEKGDWRALAAHINRWLEQTPNSANAWFHKAEFLRRAGAANYLEGYERALTRQQPSLSLSPREINALRLELCLGLYHAGYVSESVHCSAQITDAEILERYRSATFGERLIVQASEAQDAGLYTLRDERGGKLITNDPALAREHGPRNVEPVSAWRPIRFPPSDVDAPLRKTR